MDWSKLTLVEGQQLLAEPCLEIVAFSFASPSAVGAGFERLLRAFTREFSGRFAYYRTGDMKGFRPFDHKALEGPLHWFGDEKILATKMLGFQVHSGHSEKEVASPSAQFTLLGFQQPPCYVVRLTLPVAAGSVPERVISFVQDALGDLSFTSGLVGYSFYWDRTDPHRQEKVPPWAAPLLRRHPGLGYYAAVALSNAADRGVAAVGWLTLLGPQITAGLGGYDALQRRAPAEVSVLPLGAGGAIVRAGAEPQLGDVNRQEMLPAYRAAGLLVAAQRTPDEAFEDVAIDGMSDESADEWLRRFFI